MKLLRFVRVAVMVMVPVVLGQEVKPINYKIGAEICNKLTKEPFFDPELVIGKSWRIYYTWNMKLDDKCLDMTFKNVTPMITNRVFNDMYDYLESQPYWDAATLLVTMGRANHEMLLFADQGAAGRFIGVPNVVRDGNITPMRGSVPLLNFQMKLLHGGKYLLMSDCRIGVTTMSVRRHNMPYRADIGGVVSFLDYGDGFHSCVTDKNKDEQIGRE